jgi:Pro-kumamolisin, activation domain
MRSIGHAQCKSLVVAAALGLALATLCLAVPSARADRSARRGSSSPRITFYFGLRRPEAQARRAFFAVQQPGSSNYRRFLTPGQVAARYGASVSVRSRFVRDIRRYGFSARIDPSGVFARVTGSVALFERVFKVRITQGDGRQPAGAHVRDDQRAANSV